MSSSIQIIKSTIGYLFFYYCVCILAVITFFSCNTQDRKNDKHTGEVFVHYEKLTGRNGQGFGYLLLAGKDTVIKQDIIPAIHGIHTFKTEEDAQKVARLVIDKLHNRQSPAVDSMELVKLGIIFQ